jgi:hypothetical protein
LRGTPGVQPEVELLADALRREGARSVTAESDSIEFMCPGISGMRRTALLAPISGGSIHVSARDDVLELKYRLEFVLTFWASLGFGILFALLSLRNDPLKVGAFAFSWLFFGNVVISMFRFPRFLRRVLSGG